MRNRNKGESAGDRAKRYEEALVRVWLQLDNAGDSRQELQEARDDIQTLIAEEVPDVADQATEIEDEERADADTEDDEEAEDENEDE
jgi:hypothetical protein